MNGKDLQYSRETSQSTTARCSHNLQPPGIPRPFRRRRIRQPIPSRMPRKGRHTAGARLHGMDRITGLSVVDLQARSRSAGLVARAAQEPPVETPADAAHGAAVFARHGTAAHPVRRIPERNQCVAAADCQVATGRGQCKRKTGGAMRVQDVARFEGWVGEDFDRAFAGSYEEVELVV